MKLKRLEIYGFKSFADRTQILFEEGITGIVGPNGSGKSNIGDAVRWVLGEQKASSLRGSKMEDIIFGGTQTRKAAKYCEVSLIFDNTDAAAELDYSEIMVTRRVYRSGESEYYLNKTSCRLKDIVDLFRDTGIGKEGYSLIGQGRIAEILSARSDDRRRIFEEAAGIVKYRARKEEAQKRLRNTDENMLRVDDLLDEIGSQIEPLREQAEKARRYLALMESLKALELAAFVQKHDSVRERLAKIEEQKAEFDAREQDITLRLDEAAKGHEEAKQAQEQAISAMDAFHADMLEDTRILETAEGEQRVLEERISFFAQDIERYARQIAELQSRIDNASLDEGEIARKQGEAEARLHETQALCAEREQLVAEASARLSAQEAEIETAKNAMIDQLNRLSDVRSAQTRLSTMRLNLIEQKKRSAAAIEALEKEAPKQEKSMRAAQEALRLAREKLSALNEDTAALDAEVHAVQERMQTRQDEAAKLQAELQSMRSRIKVLREMKDDYEGYQHSVRRVMKHAKQTGAQGIYGVVADLLHVPEQFERAIDMALGGALQNIVTQDEQDAKQMIQYLRENNYGRATFLPVETVRPSQLSQHERRALSMPGCLGIASELIEYDPKYHSIMANLLGRTVIAEDFDKGAAIQRAGGHSFRLVTLQGDVMHSGGKITGGSRSGRATSFLTRERELAQQEQKYREGLAAHKAMEQETQGIADTLAAAKARRQEGFNALHQEEIAVARDTERLDKATAAQEDFLKRREGLAQEAAIMDETLADIEKELADISGRQGEEQDRNENAQAEIAAAQAALAQERTAFEDMQAALSELRMEAFSQQSAIDQLRQDENRRQKEAAEAAVTIEKAREQHQQAQEQEKQAQRALEQKRLDIAARRDGLAVHDARRQELEAARQAAQKRVEALAATMEELRQERQSVRDRRHQTDINATKLDGDLRALTERIWEEYELTYEGCLEYTLGELSLAQAEKQIGSIRQEVRALGHVNVNAVEDFQTTNARFEELTAQREDLLRARGDLEGIIGELTQRMQTQFKERFTLLNEYFQETFSQLFGGGKAMLYLKDENDVLDCDIEIDAQPPGKKLQLLSLLSGGERALTAIAILFAMLKLKPTPFCILDEIEAALDEANIVHFANYLAEYSKNTQFVVVTHRKGTMECCDALYGVAMEEKGVSKLISVQLEQRDAV